MTKDSSSSTDILNRAYDELDLSGGAFFNTSDSLTPSSYPEEWRAVGEWLILAERMGAERVFFVGTDPVVLFARLPNDAAEVEILTAYRRAWSLVRPKCLFLATENELRIYSLSAPPIRSTDERQQLQPLQIITRAADVAERLAMYHRERIEAGTLFEDVNFRSRSSHADVHLLNDVQSATRILRDRGLNRTVAHALIERIILIRYLEDRGVVNSSYFQEIAQAGTLWKLILERPSEVPALGAQSVFVSCLGNREFTYAVFRRLADDFNGDLFVVSDDEFRAVTGEHLEILRRLFTGSGFQGQDYLFLWAYDFGVVPTSLISSMYEQFYHAGADADDDSGTHYTPPELVEYVLSQTLTDDVLKNEPRVCDPACGSGTFLVEAFRHIVRHEMTKDDNRLSPTRLRELLLDRIVGIDINREAVQLAAFSLYLAYLNYQSPSDIQEAGPLPRLIRRSNKEAQPAVLVVADAFSATETEITSDEHVVAPLPWPSNSFDVLVGNLPWDEPRGQTRALADEWAVSQGLPVGDRSRSQLFLWRALSLIKPSGIAALLVNATGLHNSRQTSKTFRREWLQRVDLVTIVNFTAAREVFFSGGIAPYFLLKFRLKSDKTRVAPIEYRTIRPSSALTNSGSVSFARAERRWVDQKALLNRDYLWKTYAWGNQHDDGLMARLDAEDPLHSFLPFNPSPGYGYQRGQSQPSDVLATLRSLRKINSWGPLQDSWFEPPPVGVKRQPDERLYRGRRILIARGVRTEFGPRARLESEPFSFRHTIYCLPVSNLPAWQAKCILGVLLSSLGRYRIFMTNGSWGVWHDSLVPGDILGLPMRFAGAASPITRRLTRTVDMLPKITDSEPRFFSAGSSTLNDILAQINDAVFDLFELSDAERDLVCDFHAQTLDLVNNKARSRSLLPLQIGRRDAGRLVDVQPDNHFDFGNYLRTFLTRWNRELAPEGELSWQLIASKRSPLVAAVFETRVVGDEDGQHQDATEWEDVLSRLSASLEDSVDGVIRTEGVIRSVSDTSIIIVERNESRLWTASVAREDAEATMLQAMALQGHD